MPRAFKIEFDILQGHNPNTGAVISAELLNPYGWRSIGASRGGRFANRTGGILTAISIKVNKAGDTLDVTPEAGGRLFPTIWLKNDATEAIFLDGHIPVNPNGSSTTGVFWMRVPRNDEEDLSRCTDCHQQTSGACEAQCPFTGQAFQSNPPDPPAAEWRKIRADFRTLDERWRSLMAACPSTFREIQAYGDSPDGRYTLFLSNGDVLLFDASVKSVGILDDPATDLVAVNEILFHMNQFVLAANGATVRTIALSGSNSRFHEVGCQRP